MTRQTRILMGGIVLNLCVYFATAAYFTHRARERVLERYAKFTAVAANGLFADTYWFQEVGKRLLNEYDSGTRTLAEPLEWLPTPIFSAVDLAVVKNGTVEHPIRSNTPLTAPPALLRAPPFSYIRYGIDRRLYLSNSLDFSAGEKKPAIGGFLTLRIDQENLNSRLRQLGISYAIVDDSEGMRPLVIYSGLKKEDTEDLLTLTAKWGPRKIAALDANDVLPDAYESAVITSFSGIKQLVFPKIVSSNEKIRQFFLFVMTVPNDHQIDLRSFVLFIVAVFTAVVGVLAMGLIGTTDRSQKNR